MMSCAMGCADGFNWHIRFCNIYYCSVCSIAGNNNEVIISVTLFHINIILYAIKI